MAQELWLNLPVKNLEKTKAFFLALGFEALRDAPEMVGLKIGGVPVMMVTEAQFEKSAFHKAADTSKSNEILISISAPNRAYVDEMEEKVKAAGGKVFAEPEEMQGWMYNMGFTDLDGHRWNILHMDTSKMSTK